MAINHLLTGMILQVLTYLLREVCTGPSLFGLINKLWHLWRLTRQGCSRRLILGSAIILNRTVVGNGQLEMVNSHKCPIPIGTSMERSMGMRFEGPTFQGVLETHVQMLCIVQLLAHKLKLFWSCDQFTSFLGDGFKYLFIFTPTWGEMIQID